jgi:histidinol-phosphate aminotransferase
MKELVPPHIAAIRPYEPGKPIAELERELGLSSTVKLASNENPLGPSAKAVRAMRASLKESHRYPDGGSFELTRALAGRFDVPESGILLGNGSNELIEIIIRTFLRPGEEVISAKGAFVVYYLVTQAAGGRNVVVPMKDHTHDLAAMADAVTERSRIVFVANPNNPTGTWVGRKAVDRFLDALPEGVIAVFDEAYYEYVARKTYPDTLSYVREGRPVIALRTFSKAYGLAGLRLGYLMAPERYVVEMNKVRQPFNTNHLAQAAALAALEDERHLRRVVRLNKRERRGLEQQLQDLGLSTLPSEANFLLVDVGRDGGEVYQELLRRGVIVRPMGGYGYPGHLRVTVGLPEENARFIEELRAVLSL